jgi:hypothetical protein
MLKWAAIPLLTALVLQAISLPFLAIRLEVDRETVAIPMCVNKERTDIQCLGNCYINQHLEAALAQSEQQSGETTPLSPPMPTPSPQWLGQSPNWSLCLPLRSHPVLHPHHPQWQGGDYRRPEWQPPRV